MYSVRTADMVVLSSMTRAGSPKFHTPKAEAGSSAMVTLNIASEDGEDPKVSAPAADAKIYDFADENAINEYAENIDLITFLTTLKQNCGLDLTSLLLGTMQ